MANFLKKDIYEDVLLTDNLALISNAKFIDDVINKISLNKLFGYKLRKLRIEDIVTIDVFKTIGTKVIINNSPVIYIGDLQKLFELKEN